MTEYELRTRLNAETIRRTYMQKELEDSQNENQSLREQIDCLEKIIANLKADLSKEINSYHIMSEEYQMQIRILRQEKAELQEIIENGKEIRGD